MEKFAEDEIKEAQVFTDFYIDLIENSLNYLKFYLAEDVVVDWFGQTVEGDKNASVMLNNKLSRIKHFMSPAKPVEKIGFRDKHIVKMNKKPKKICLNFLSPIRDQEPKTPPKQTQQQPSTSSCEKGQGDHLQLSEIQTQPPIKKFKCDGGGGDGNIEFQSDDRDVKVKYVQVEGSIEFHRSSIKKLQTETKWMRPCKLSIAYTGSNSQDATIYLVIYEGAVKCRRNLMKDFLKVDD